MKKHPFIPLLNTNVKEMKVMNMKESALKKNMMTMMMKALTMERKKLLTMMMKALPLPKMISVTMAKSTMIISESFFVC